MRRVVFILSIITTFAFNATAQSESDLRKYFEGKSVVLRIDMPAHVEVNVYPERSQSLNYSEYTARLKNNGVSIKRSASATINCIEINDTHIEVSLVSTTSGSSRFNIHFSHIQSWMLTPATLIDALNRFVEFSQSDKISARLPEPGDNAAGFVRNGVIHLGPRTTYLKPGLSSGEVRQLLGEPSSVVQRNEEGKLVSIYEFPRGEGKILVAEFVGDALVDSRTETRDSVSVAVVDLVTLP